MKILKVIFYSFMGLLFGSMLSMMVCVMFYTLFISNEPYPMNMFWRIIVFVALLIMCVGFSIEAITKEIREHNLINEIKRLKK